MHGLGHPSRLRRLGRLLLALLLSVLDAALDAGAQVLQQARVAGVVVLYGLVDGDLRQVRGEGGQVRLVHGPPVRQLGPRPLEVGVSERDVLAPLVLLPLVELQSGPMQLVVQLVLHVLVMVQRRELLRSLRDAGVVDVVLQTQVEQIEMVQLRHLFLSVAS